MNLWKRLRQLSIPNLLGFGWLLMRRPLLIYPIWKATKRTMELSDQLYGKAHFGNGKANAFRHAYWNYLLCSTINTSTKNKVKSIVFTQNIVDYYEKVTQNELLDRKMDFHNNEIGRNLFLSKNEENESKMVVFIQKMANSSQKVITIDDFIKFENTLVYLIDEPMTTSEFSKSRTSTQ